MGQTATHPAACCTTRSERTPRARNGEGGGGGEPNSLNDAQRPTADGGGCCTARDGREPHSLNDEESRERLSVHFTAEDAGREEIPGHSCGVGCGMGCAHRERQNSSDAASSAPTAAPERSRSRSSCGEVQAGCPGRADLGPLCLGEAVTARGGGDGHDESDDYDLYDGGATGGTGDTGGSQSSTAPTRDCMGSPHGLFLQPNFSSDRPSPTNGGTGRQALFGDKALRPKMLRLQALEGEMEALERTRQQISNRLSSSEGASPRTHSISIPNVLEAGATDEPALSLSEWVHRLLQYEEALHGVTARAVKEACSSVMGSTSRLISFQEVKASYVEILGTVQKQAIERIADSRAEHERLDNEVSEIEDFISLCFEKMDEEGRGSVTKKQFVAFICGEGDKSNSEAIHVDQKDAGALFDQMLRGSREMSFQLFKDEITHGCLQVMRGNLALRSAMLKRYRDWWY